MLEVVRREQYPKLADLRISHGFERRALVMTNGCVENFNSCLLWDSDAEARLCVPEEPVRVGGDPNLAPGVSAAP
jgi:hypothetical protein